MSKDLKNITDSVMDEIRSDRVRMRPRMYFVLGSVLAFIGLVSSVVLSIYMVGLMRFLLRSHGPMGSVRLDEMLSNFPWWAPVLALVGLITGTWLMQRYDFSFKVGFRVLIIGFVFAVIAGGILVDSLGLNDVLMERGPMREMMRQYVPNSDHEGGPRGNRYRAP